MGQLQDSGSLPRLFSPEDWQRHHEADCPGWAGLGLPAVGRVQAGDERASRARFWSD